MGNSYYNYMPSTFSLKSLLKSLVKVAEHSFRAVNKQTVKCDILTDLHIVCFWAKCFWMKWTWGTLQQPIMEPSLMQRMRSCSQN